MFGACFLFGFKLVLRWLAQQGRARDEIHSARIRAPSELIARLEVGWRGRTFFFFVTLCMEHLFGRKMHHDSIAKCSGSKMSILQCYYAFCNAIMLHLAVVCH